jgi:branched-chain amino acid aminotransferase
MSSTFVSINGEIIPEAEASIYINDLSIQRGYGIFDFFKLVNGRPIFLDDHLTRFYNSAAQMRLHVKQNPEELKELLFSLMAKNNLPDSGVRMTLTGGYSHDGFSIGVPNLIITQQLYTINEDAVLTGSRLVTYSHQRQLPQVKSIDYLMAIWLKNYITENQADDVLYHQNGIIAECPRSNLFIVSKEGNLLTPARNILKGIIRKHVLILSKSAYRVEERDITLDEIYNAQEVFVTSTTRNIQPVVMVDGHVISNGMPGETTKSLLAELSVIINQHAQLLPL